MIAGGKGPVKGILIAGVVIEDASLGRVEARRDQDGGSSGGQRKGTVYRQGLAAGHLAWRMTDLEEASRVPIAEDVFEIHFLSRMIGSYGFDIDRTHDQ